MQSLWEYTLQSTVACPNADFSCQAILQIIGKINIAAYLELVVVRVSNKNNTSSQRTDSQWVLQFCIAPLPVYIAKSEEVVTEDWITTYNGLHPKMHPGISIFGCWICNQLVACHTWRHNDLQYANKSC